MSQIFPEYKQLDLVFIGKEVKEQWRAHDTFKKSISAREGQPGFVFYEGPPSANGKPGIHHVLGRAIKDLFCRYQTLKGNQVRRKAGWDTHGLPVELGVEKELGITKEDIGEKISVEDYNEACKKAVLKYTNLWNDLTEQIGYWVDMDAPYVTYHPKYIETVWWLLKQFYNKGLLYKGYTIQPYSPKAGTGLSSHELSLPGVYQDVTDTTVVAQFRAIPDGHSIFEKYNGEIYFLAWTTTPWTLPSNTALTVGPNIEYVLVKTYNQYTHQPVAVVLAKSLIQSNFGKKYTESVELNHQPGDKKIPYKILQQFTGKELVGIRYEQLLSWATPYKNAENAFQVIAGDFVTTEDGTGIVHTAPTFGADDAKVATENNIPAMLILDKGEKPVPLVDLQGRFVDSLPEGFGGKYVKNEYYPENEAPERSIDVEIAILLKEENKAFKVEKYKHTYPHCWRTDKPVLYYPLDSWFIQVSKERQTLVELNKKIHWKPESTGTGRFGNWLENANDWNLSRSRFWGIPLPIWRTEEGKEEKIIGSIEELQAEIKKAIEHGMMEKDPFEGFTVGDFSEKNYDLVDLHKNIVDQIILVSDGGEPMHRETDLIDVWFDSGAMPFAQWHYPFENKEFIDNKTHWPADFIAEGVDQTRGWFYTLHTISGLLFNERAYKTVVSNGLVLDKNGQKMSKRLGNAVDPFEVLNEYGPDATRWYMISNAQPWENLKFDLQGIDEVRRKFFGTLHNTYNFFALYANIDAFNFKEEEIPLHKRPEADRWILSELQTLINTCERFYDDYEPTRAARAIQDFTGDVLSNWYVRLNRRRFWKGDYGQDKLSAYQTLHRVLHDLAILSSPIAPFYADNLYQNLTNNLDKRHQKYESVHLAYFPKANEEWIDQDLQSSNRLAQRIVSLGFSIRKKEKVRVRQALQKVVIPVLDQAMKNQIEALEDIIKQELNVKEMQLLSDKEAGELLVKKIKPNFQKLGPKYGQQMKLIAKGIQSLTQEEIRAFEASGAYNLTVDGQEFKLTIDDVEILAEDIPGWALASHGRVTVALDLNLTPELIKEGIAREFVNRVQNLRKQLDFEVTDRIKLTVQSLPKIQEALTENNDYIKQEVLGDELNFEPNVSGQTVEINEHSFEVQLEVVQ